MTAIRNASQNARLHILISETYPAQLRADMKEDLALEYSGNRTKRTSELTPAECDMAINALQLVRRNRNGNDSKQLNKMFAVMRSLNWDYSHLSDFIKKQTQGAKNHSRQLTAGELNKVISAMEQIEIYKTKKK